METKKTILIADTSEEFRTVLAEAIQAEEGLEVVGQTGGRPGRPSSWYRTATRTFWSWTWSWSGWTALTCWRR